ncbi:uncharacterized protein LOC135119477 isoform X2 [Zophobas morio]|uniref:uncharacterized protein LOC135119477 isoform X2 n=1 Tax=Zophobas morio TaxID=2755281 RepID=UPI003083D3BE
MEEPLRRSSRFKDREVTKIDFSEPLEKSDTVDKENLEFFCGTIFELEKDVATKRGRWASSASERVANSYFGAGHNHLVYSMALRSDKQYIALAGGEGKVSIYSLELPDYSESALGAGSGEELSNFALLGTSKMHRRWVSRITYVLGASQANFLLTSSDDGSLYLSEYLDKHETQNRFSIVLRSKLCLKDNNFHTKGIFGLSFYERQCLTCSKDGSICHSRLSSDGLQALSLYWGHCSVAKDVQWQTCQQMPPTVFASVGNDKTIGLYDVRLPNALVQRVENSHQLAINNLRFDPFDGNYFLTASFDKTIVMHDMRGLGKPLHTWADHHGRSVRKPSLTSPVFYKERGNVLAAGDRTSSLFLYASNVGKLLKKMFIGGDATSLESVEGIAYATQGKQRFWQFTNGL